MQRKTLSWVCTKQNPWRGHGLSSGCKSTECFRERWFAFLRNLESNLILPSVLHVVSSSFYTMFSELSIAKLVLLLFYLLLFCFDYCSKTVIGLTVMRIVALISLLVFNWQQLGPLYVNMTATIQT